MAMASAALPLLSLLVASPQSAAPTTSSGDLHAVLERHISWLGGDAAIARLRSITERGALKTDGLEGHYRRFMTVDGWRRFTMDLGLIKGDEVIGPAGAWARNLSGQVYPVGAEEAASERRAITFELLRHLRDPQALGAGVRRLDRGSLEHDERRWRVIRYEIRPGTSRDIYLDPRDGSCGWIREEKEGEGTFSRLSDWRFVGGVRFPFFIVEESDDGPPATFRRTEVKVNAPIPASTFVRPTAGNARVRFSYAGRAPVRLPARMVRGQIFVEGRLNDCPVRMMLDNGAQATLVPVHLASKCGLEVQGDVRVSGSAGSQKGGFSGHVRLSVGALELANLTVAVTDLSHVEQIVGPFVLVGREVFESAVVEMDYPNAKVIFHDPRRFRPAADARKVPLRPGNGARREVMLAIEDHPPAWVSIDTGAGGTLNVNGFYAEKFGLLKGRRQSRGAFAAMGGFEGRILASLKKITFAGFELLDVPVDFDLPRGSGFIERHLAGNLGGEILKRFRIAFDFAGGRLFVSAPAGFQAQAFVRERAGMKKVERNGFHEVVYVAPDGPAHRAGFKEGDKIVAMDGVPASSPQSRLATSWEFGAAGTRVELTDDSGRKRTLILSDYY